MRVGLNGGMTFWSFDRLHKLQEYILGHVGLKFVIFECADITGLDSSGAAHLITSAQSLQSTGIKIIFHGLSETHLDILTKNAQVNPVWQITQTESEIKDILEKNGVKHSVQDVLQHGVQKYLVDFTKE